MRTIDITREPVELYKILKFEGLVTTGGEAKLLIGDGQVRVNGEVELRKRRQMRDGDTIDFRGEQIKLRLL
ncbi:RNA-binding S4 domain-containing protein [Haliea sp.]|jgi:ribosome-associated protein|uniref:RNA-binding S4 domain-containing protein n=1 Tax=Haliea sp. TaxID=1932666 RepID=UPI000C37FF6E|nr:RNA-binding S4 domain-containing protein [Haliea sp.]HBM83623.1 RNA-binding protein [Halieaceae bacterium]MAD62394.1 RNA-binding protein [Haliea sp.]MAY91383.1 RNA-binding protein [Haliea sp.]MBK41083.1 RNA-binding protein [Haliea sp.]MBP71103.1 RNA-binding protein [Haliea sp.]|tara:strand:+ start:2018 stop:2230 length:213 start_codon:yes stop_codon:yes gene_type:complete